MRFDEGPEPRLPKDVRQAGIAVQFVIALDQAAALRDQVLRQETEIKVRGLVGKLRATRIVRKLCHDFVSPRDQRTDFAQCILSITSSAIYLRSIVGTVLIGKK